MTDVFDDMPDAFLEEFGEAIEYAGITGTIQAIWLDNPAGTTNLGFADSAAVDQRAPQLHVSEADVPDPQEGDIVTRIKTGDVRKVVPPIQPDGKGMITCMLAIVT